MENKGDDVLGGKPDGTCGEQFVLCTLRIYLSVLHVPVMLIFHGVDLCPGFVLLVDSFRYLWYMRLSKPDIHVESYSNMLYTWDT